MILAPHPYDELLSSFKLMRDAYRAGAGVKVLFLTDGEHSQLAHMRPKKKYGLARRAEAEAALRHIGPVECEFWGLPASGLTKALSATDTLRRFRLLLSAFSPTILVSPVPGELHPDHSAAAVLAEIGTGSMPEGRRPVLLRYALHLGRRFHPEEFGVRFGLSGEEKKEKLTLAGFYQGRGRSLRRLLPRAADAEYFSRLDDAGGPRLTALFNGGGYAWFRTDFTSRLRPVRFTALYHDGTTCARAGFTLNWNKTSAKLRDLDSGRVLGHAGFQRSFKRPGGLLILPLKAGSGLGLLGVKASRRLEYLDAAGFVKAAPPAARSDPFTCVVIPCHNVEEFCGQAVAEAARYADRVIAVDDGSTDGTHLKLLEAAKTGKVRVIKFPENRGKGAALLEGMRTALKETACDLVLTMDGDMTHRPGDIPAFKRAWSEGGEFIIGYRSPSGKVPLRRRLGDNIINSFVRLFLNKGVIDSRSGFRGFSRDCAAAMINSPAVRGSRYETEIDMISEALKGNWRLAQVEIPAIYIEGNKKASFRPVADSYRMTKTLMLNMSGLRKPRRGSKA